MHFLLLLPRAPREPNLLILHDAPHARVHKEFINEGVTRADPDYYLQRYGGELHNWNTSSYLVDEAVRAVPPPSIDFHCVYLWDNMQSVPVVIHNKNRRVA